MRRIISSGSVKAICLDKEEILAQIQRASVLALEEFPEIKEIRLFGSFATGKVHALSDVDIILIVERALSNDPIQRIKPYYSFFSRHINIALDLLVIEPEELEHYKDILKESRKVPLNNSKSLI